MISSPKRTPVFFQCMGCGRSHCIIHCRYPSIIHTVGGNWTTLVSGRASSPTATTFLCIEFLGSLANLSVWLESFSLSFATRDMVLSSTSLTFVSTTPSPPPSSIAAPLTSVCRNGTGATPTQHNTTQYYAMGSRPRSWEGDTSHVPAFPSTLRHVWTTLLSLLRTHLCAIASSSSPSCVAWCCCGRLDWHRTQARRLETRRKPLCRRPSAGSTRSSTRACSCTSWESRRCCSSEQKLRRIHGKDVSVVQDEGTGWHSLTLCNSKPSDSV